MKRLVCAAFAAALLVPGTWAVGAHAKDKVSAERGAPPAEKGANMAERAKETLGLTDDQEAKFKDAMKAHTDAVKPLKRKLRDGMIKLGDQLQDKAGDDAIKATLDSLKSARQELSAEQEKFHDSLAAFLTPTQQAKLVLGMAKRMHQGMMGQPGMMGQGRPGMMGQGRPGMMGQPGMRGQGRPGMMGQGRPGMMGGQGGGAPAPKDEDGDDDKGE